MEARVKATGKIVELQKEIGILDYARGLYRDTDGNRYHWKELEFIKDKIEGQIDWEVRRYEIAKEIYTRNYGHNEEAAKICAQIAIERANILIAELKEEHEKKNTVSSKEV